MWLSITIAGIITVYALELWLDLRQSDALASATIPPELRPHITEKQFSEMQRYSKLRASFSRLESTYGCIAEVGAILSGVFAWTWRAALDVNSLLGLGPDAHIARAIMFLILVSLFSAVMKFPFEYFRLFVLDAQFSLDETITVRKWCADQIKMAVLSIVIGVPVLYAALTLIDVGAVSYWLHIWAATGVLSLLLMDIYPRFLGPLFSRFVVLEPCGLRTAIENLAKELHFPLREIYVIESAASNVNAFVAGFGNNKRIVMYDALVKQFTTTEICAILAHEMGHYRQNHVVKQWCIQMASVGTFLFLLSRLIENPDFYRDFGFYSVEPGVGICLFSMLYSPLGSVLHGVTNLWLRAFEYSADAFAWEHGHRMDAALIKMHCHNVYNLVVDKWYSRYYLPHPSLMERLERLAYIIKKRT
jgi:STE24 endopeptidase